MRWPLAAIALILFLTTDDRHAGAIADGRQMIWTAVAITETGGLGQARGRDLAVARPSGDSVSRFGLGMSFAQIPAALVAPSIERRFGPASSQPLFLIAPFVCVLAAAMFAAVTAKELGGSVAAQRMAVLLSTLASPLGSYVALDSSEPLQAAALAGAFAASLIAARGTRAIVFAALAGFAAGVAVLTKSSLIVVAPLCLLPLFLAVVGRPFRAGVFRPFAAAASGFIPAFCVWLYFEVVRFGRPFASYAGESFSHPVWDGAWRLLAGPNEGLVLFCPASILIAVAWWRARRARSGDWLPLATVSLVLAALLAIAAPWWAWHGDFGWGPRLLIPVVPLIAACAARELCDWPRQASAAVLAGAVLVNVPPLVQHPIAVTTYQLACDWPVIDRHEAATLPRFALREEAGRLRVSPTHVLPSVARASDFLVLPWFWGAAMENDAASVARQLESPPWKDARPDIVPTGPLSADRARELASPARWSFWGRGFSPDAQDASQGNVYDAGLANQVLRAQQQREIALALRLAEKLESLAPSGFADALLIESYRLLGRQPAAAGWLSGLPRERRMHPAINVVLALFERDAGNENDARAFLASVVKHFPNSPVESALKAPMKDWPADFATMTGDPTLEVPLTR